ncbi:hypothetical protein GCM10011571_32770 [Marinithermofilum abyssi]|uniref:Conjugative transposon protein TcpC n=1 Tax=Marinithermofilum abyssi TaxID=1571185 RepID=A0A8J2VKE9_9BACL|nr:conjugal transfer protein [Marinithermofilum abyssi]GGE28117.1 hypothetical protein GCM10011571_32770 [Marinithermofilum abyssi]
MGKPKPPEQPKPIQGMKTKRVLHWGLLALTPVSAAVVLGLSFTGNIGGGTQAQATPTEVKEENPAMQSKAQAFAIAFASEYLYATGDSADHQKRIAPYLADGMAGQAGMTLDDGKRSMYPGEIRYWESRPIGPNQAEIVLQVDLYFVEGKQPKERRIRYLAVPVEVKGPDRMAVIGTPHFVPVSVKADGIKKHTESLGNPKEEVDSNTTQAIQNFLKDFFQDYATGTKSDLAYKTATNKPIRGFEGEMQFKALDSVEVAPRDGGYTALARVVFMDPRSNAQLTYDYKVALIQDEGQWKVQALQYVN